MLLIVVELWETNTITQRDLVPPPRSSLSTTTGAAGLLDCKACRLYHCVHSNIIDSSLIWLTQQCDRLSNLWKKLNINITFTVRVDSRPMEFQIIWQRGPITQSGTMTYAPHEYRQSQPIMKVSFELLKW